MRNRRNKRKNIKKNNAKIIAISAGVVICILLFLVIFAIINMGSDKIVAGVKVENIDISKLTNKEAKEKLDEWYKNTILQEIKVNYGELEETINIEEFEPEENIDKIIGEATKIGRSGNIIKDNFDILCTLISHKEFDINIEYNNEKLDKKIEEISGKLPGAVVETSYYIDKKELVIKKGQPGIIIDKEKFKENIENAIRDENNKNIVIPVQEIDAGEINLEKIHEEIYKEPQDAYITQNPTQVHAHVNGVDFAITFEEAQEIIKEDKEEYIIPLKITEPEKTLANLGVDAFPDKLGEFTTRYDASNKNRSINLGLASDKIDGTIVQPGEKFSYNKIVGERTISKGYKEAAIYSGGKVVEGIGGGICQLSSTLYNAVLYANLEVTSRTNHRFVTSYVQPGRDATVSWGTIDLCFKNTRSYPIKISSTVNNGIVKVEIYGIKEENEYEIEIETNILETIDYKTIYINDSTLEEGLEIIEQLGNNGGKSETYKIIKQNGIIVSKILISTDTYSSLDQTIRKGTKKALQDQYTNKEEISITGEKNTNIINENPFAVN